MQTKVVLLILTLGGMILDVVCAQGCEKCAYGAPIDLPTLYSWREIQGSRTAPITGILVIPGMPPGSYSLCQLSFSEALAVFDGVALPRDEGCSSGELAPDNRLALDLPTTQRQ